MQYVETRAEWEQGLEPLSVMEEEYRVLVILQSKRGEKLYHCHRYFRIGDEWACSIDGQDVSLEAVFSWLNDPSATSTRQLIKPKPMSEPTV